MGAITKAAVERFMKAGVPEGKPHATLRDSQLQGLGLRLRPSGTATWLFVYRRKGLGRAANQKTVTIGRWPVIGVETAREKAKKYVGQVAHGGDPRADIIEEARRQRAIVSAALDEYENWIRGRKLANAPAIISALRRGLATVARRDLSELDRPLLVEAIERISRSGKLGAARDFRTHLMSFMERQVSVGTIKANPLAGYRMPGRTRDEKAEQEQAGRALTADETRAVWQAADAMGGPFSGLVKMALASGLRRGEMAQMRRSWIDRAAGRIVIPGRIMKAGTEHAIPITPTLAAIIDAQPDRGGDLLFASERRLGGNTPLSGWSKLLAKLRDLSGVEGIGLHDLRRTYRSALADLGVPEPIAEIMIAHKRPDLISRYNRAEQWELRLEAAAKHDRWLQGTVGPQGGGGEGKIVRLPVPRGRPASPMKPASRAKAAGQ